MNLQEQADPTSQATLESWKEIAAYLRRDAKTARKWEKEEGLPIHRHSHKSRSSVYAYPSEIDRWRATRKVVAEPPPPTPVWRRLLTPSFAVTLALCLVMVGNGVRPQLVEAQQGQTRNLVCSGADCDGAKISPDGKSLLVRLNGGLSLREIATKKIRPVVEAATGFGICCPRFSPDGSRLAYTIQQPSGAPVNSQPTTAQDVIVVNVDGTKRHMVYHGGSSAAWSPDGKRLLVAELNSPPDVTSLLWVDVASGAVQKLPAIQADLDAARVSPDGKYVAFNATRDGGDENVFITALDGSGTTVVSPSAAYQEPIEWTADGKTLIYTQSGGAVNLWAVHVSNGKVQGPAFTTNVEFAKGVGFLGADRQGAMYYRIVSATSDVFTATLDRATGKVTSGAQPIPINHPGENAVPRWSPDSRRLLFNWTHPFANGTNLSGSAQEYHIYSFDTLKEERVAEHVRLGRGAYCFGGDGASILFNSGENPKQQEVARFDLGSGKITPLFPGATPFIQRSCSNDKIAGSDQNGIRVRSIATGSEKQAYKFEQNPGAVLPVLSHDGRSVAFVASGRLHVVPSDGGAVRDLAAAISPAEFQLRWGAAWSPDDKFVYFSRRPDGKSAYELFRVPATGGPTESMDLKAEDLRDLDIAPDGSRIVFSTGAFNRPEIWAIQKFLPSK